MSRKAKLLARLQERPKDFTWDEAVTVMTSHGFEYLKGGGSRRKFFHAATQTLVSIHEPHPDPTLKAYQIRDLLEGLKNAEEM